MNNLSDNNSDNIIYLSGPNFFSYFPNLNNTKLLILDHYSQ